MGSRWKGVAIATVPLGLGIMMASHRRNRTTGVQRPPAGGGVVHPVGSGAVEPELGGGYPPPFNELPDGRTREGLQYRDGEIAARIVRGEADDSLNDTRQVTLATDGMRLKCDVMADAAKLGGVRVSLTYGSTAMVAEELGLWVPTPHAVTQLLRPEVHSVSVGVLRPLNQPWVQDGTMALTSRMVEYDAIVSAALDKAGWRNEFILNVGKWWVLWRGQAGHPTKACNFGWFTNESAPGGAPIQGPGLAHGWGHVDYSQVARWWYDAAQLDTGGGYEPCRLSDVVTRPNVAKLLTGGSPLAWGTPRELRYGSGYA